METENPIDELIYQTRRQQRLEDREDLGPFVYFIRHHDQIKIGTSINPAKRLAQLCRSNDRTIRPPWSLGEPELVACIPGSARDERLLHRRFAEQRVCGEWFWINHELRWHVVEAAFQQITLELELMGSGWGTDLSQEFYTRKCRVIDRMAHEDIAFEYDTGEDIDELFPFGFEFSD